MSLALVRIDSRLIHGQIIEAWVPFLHSDCILVADDRVASDPMQKTIMRMSVPRDVAVEIAGIHQMVDEIREGKWMSRTCLLIFSDCESVRRAHEFGLAIPKLNVGNIHHETGRVQVTASIALNEEDVAYLKDLEHHGVRIEFRAVPRQKAVPFGKLKLPFSDNTNH